MLKSSFPIEVSRAGLQAHCLAEVFPRVRKDPDSIHIAAKRNQKTFPPEEQQSPLRLFSMMIKTK